MRKLNRLTMTLALLIMAVGGAWADEAKVYTEAVALNSLKAGDVLTDGFKLTTEKGQYIYVKGYKKDGGTAETSDYTQLNADNSTFPGGVTISESGSTYTPYADGKDANAWIVSDWKDLGSATMLYLDGYNYTPTEWSLKPDETGKTWTLDKMPASNVELQVEYFAESNLFLSKDALADAANIAVTAGKDPVAFGDDGKSANTVTEGTPMTVTYNGTKKLLGMKVEKKEAEEPAADIVWDVTNVTDLAVSGTLLSYEKEGIKLSGNADQVQAEWNNSAYLGTPGMEFITMESGGFTFTAPTGKAFTKIEMKAQGLSGWKNVNLGTGWEFVEDDDNEIYTVTWKGSAASTVKLLKDADMFSGDFISSIAFYLSE